MPSHQEYSSAFDYLAGSLRQSVQVIVQALQAHRGPPTGDLLDRQLEKTLERLATLLGLGTYENLSVSEIFATAIRRESLIAQEYRRAQLSQAAELHTQRVQALINAARRGNRVTVPSGPFVIDPYRGVYIRPLTAKVHDVLLRQQEHFARWREGAVATVPETLMAELAQAGAELTVLYLAADELFDQAGRLTKEALEQEFERRLNSALSDDRGIADPLQRHINRLLLHQNVVLRNLQHVLEHKHAVAHQAVQPILDETRRLLEAGLLVHGNWAEPADDPLARVIDLESKAQEHAALWLSHAQKEDEGAGWRPKLQSFVDAGTLVEELKQAYR